METVSNSHHQVRIFRHVITNEIIVKVNKLGRPTEFKSLIKDFNLTIIEDEKDYLSYKREESSRYTGPGLYSGFYSVVNEKDVISLNHRHYKDTFDLLVEIIRRLD